MISGSRLAGAVWVIAGLILLTPQAAQAQLASGTDCGCPKTGAFVDPDPGKAPYINPIDLNSGDSAASNPRYRLTATPGGPNLPANVSIVRIADSAIVLQASGTDWGFSPDEDRFLIWWLTGSIFQANLYDLTGAAPNVPIRTFSGAFTSLRFRFSEDSRFLLMAGLINGGAQVQLEYVHAATGGVRLATTLPIPTTGSIGGDADVAGWGYGPDSSRIVYSYLGSGLPYVALDNLDDASQAPLVQRPLGTSAFWQFSPCGDVFGIVNQTAGSQMQVDLWRTREAGAVIGSTTFGTLDFVTLATTATKHQAVTPGETRDLADNAAAVACPVNAPPTADFSISGILEAGQTITFTDASSDTDGTIASWSWEFGDGATSTLQNPTHVYSVGGDFDVKLTVTDNGGATRSRTKTLTLPLNLAPRADFSFDGILEAGRTITFTDASSDTDGTIVSWSWAFGDGGTSSSRNPTHIYAAGGAFSVKLTVTDDGGRTADRTQVLPICSAAVVSSGKLLYGTGTTSGDLYVLNMDGSGVVRITNSDQIYSGQQGDGSGDADYSPDGSKIAWIAAEQNDFEGSGAGLSVSNADGSGKVLLLPDNSDFMTLSHPRWTPDGRAIAFYLRELYPGPPRHGIYLIDADGSNMRLIHQAALDTAADTAAMAYPGGFSPIATCGTGPDGRIPDGCWTLAVGFQSWGPGFNHTRISKIQCGGSGVLTPITNGTADHSPRFSPDGARIAFSRGWSPEVLYVMNADGTAALPVGTHQTNTWDYDPVWSPDGSQIAFTRAYLGNGTITQRDIIVTNADGCHGNAVAIGEPYKRVLAWAPGSQTQGMGSISGHVFYGNSLASPSAEGITVTASWSGGSKSAQTDANGNYTITDIPAGVNITTISGSFPGYVWVWPGPVAGGNGYQFFNFKGHAYGVFLSMAPDRFTLIGTVKDPDGVPVPGIVIEATGQPAPIAPVTTGTDGSFSLDLRPVSSYTVRPVTAGYDYTPPSASAWGTYGAVLTQDFVAEPIVPPAVTPPILFASDRDSPAGGEKIFSIYAAEPDGSGAVRLTRGPDSDSTPAWSPDGKKIVFVRQIGGLKKLHVMGKDGTGIVNLGIEGEWPVWSPGGAKIAFSRSGSILTADADGTNETQLTADHDRRPAWSRDGKRITFERIDTSNGEIDIYEIVLATGNVTPLLVRAGYDQGPAWSADGQTLAVSFTGFIGDSGKLYTVSADGLTATDLNVFGTDPTWSPDGRLAYTTDASSGIIEVLDIATGSRQAFPKPQDTFDANPAWRVVMAPPGENNFDVAVSGNSAWTDSGIDLKVGDQVAMTAAGSIYFNYDGSSYGPGGPGNTDQSATIDPNLPFQSLVGSVGDPAVSSPPAFFEIGGSFNFTATLAGRLWLGVNAADFGNNSGSWDVHIKVTDPVVNPPAGPVTTRKSVNGTDQWTDSGVDFKAGDFLAIIAGGSIDFYYPQDQASYPYGPDGPRYNNGSASIDPDLPFQSLVGSAGDPIPLSPPAFFGIGSAYHFRAVSDGRLWLGVNAAEFANNTGSWEVAITLTPASVVFEPVAMVANSSQPAGTVGVDYGSRTIGITGGSGNFTWSWWNTYDPQYGATPAGLQLDPATGTITGTPTTPGNNYVTIQVRDNVYGMDVKQEFTLKVNAPVRMTTLWLPDGVRTAAYSEGLNAAYGTPPYSWEIVSGNLPSGLSLLGNGIGGTPDTSAVYNVTLRVTDAVGTTDQRALTITVVDPALKILTAGLLPGVIGRDYSHTLQGTYGAGTLQWALNGGSLPPGLVMDGNGRISGKPAKAGRYPFNVRLTSGTETVHQDFSIQIQAAGNLWAWGYGSSGQLGTGEKTDQNTPVPVTSSTGLTVAVAIDGGSSHSLAVDATGQVWSWGNGGNGQLGRPATAGQSPFPGKVLTAAGDPLGDIVVIAAGNLQGGMAVDRTGRLWVWGDNQQGQLGNGEPSPTRNSADPVPGLTDVVAVSSSKSSYHSLAVTAEGQVRGWGWNSYGQVGNGDFTPDGSDIHVSIPARVQGLTDITAVAAGSVHSLALDRFGRVWAWGGNTSGQLGLGTTDSSYPAHPLPVLVPGLSQITAISAGPVHSLALDSQGRLWAWGSNWNGELGLGNTSASVASPTMVPALEGLASVSSGSNFGIARDSRGSAWTWGRNYYGQLGDGRSGSGQDTATPHPLGSLNSISAVGGGNLHALALKVIAPGDLNGDGSVNLIDAIAALRISSQINVALPVYLSADVNGDEKIGLADVVYILQTVAEAR